MSTASSSTISAYQNDDSFSNLNYCIEGELADKYNLSDIYCINLEPVPAVSKAGGYVKLVPIRTPFGVAVTTEGNHRYRLRMSISGLPRPEEIGPYTAYVAWVTTPTFFPIYKLGEVDNGDQDLPEVNFNKFLILITAESSASVAERKGKIVLRGLSPSSRMQPHDLSTMTPLALVSTRQGSMEHGHHMDSQWEMPPMHPDIPMIPGMMDIRPRVRPLPRDLSILPTVPEARSREWIRFENGDQFTLDARFVRRKIQGHDLLMFGFNGQHPGPVVEVPQHSEIIVNFTNRVSLPSAIHWHGLRLDFRNDGVPGLTQELIQPGETFPYRLRFPDPGIFWFHPHFREDIKMDLGLYANILVRSPDPEYFSPVNREEVLMLDDLLLSEKGVVPHGKESSNYMLMGRFGNTFLVNGQTDLVLHARKGEVIRFFITNSSSTRTYNLVLEEQPMKVVATDVGKFEREEWTKNVVIGVAERYVIEAQFNTPGKVALTNRIQSINHQTGSFFPEVDTLAFIQVAPEPVSKDWSQAFNRLRENRDVIEDIDRFRPEFDRPVDYELVARLEVSNLPAIVHQIMRWDVAYFNPVEWSDTMPMMNWASSGEEVQWVLEDTRTGKKNMAIDWRFKVGDVVKMRLVNDRNSFHAMQHPFHIHGLRFLILQQDGIPNENLAWKDTVILPVGTVTDILVDMSNPGKWMAHCHIAEHIDSGMMFVFEVEK